MCKPHKLSNTLIYNSISSKIIPQRLKIPQKGIWNMLLLVPKDVLHFVTKSDEEVIFLKFVILKSWNVS